jgi:GT2 family glycosyltransferase
MRNNSVRQYKGFVSIIIPCFYSKTKDPKLLFSCLSSIFSSTYTNYEVIIVDDGSEISISNLLSKTQVKKNVTVIRNEHNLGYGASCNYGATIAKGEYILFLNDDMEIGSNLLEILVREIEKYPDAGILFCKEVNYSDPSIISTGGLMDPFGNTYTRKNSKDLFFYSPGAPCFMKLSVFYEIGGFDESFYLFVEDVDLSWRVRLKGYNIIYVNKGYVLHHVSATIGGFSPMRVFLYQRNTLRMLIKCLQWKSLLIFIIRYITQSFLLITYFSLKRKPEFAFNIVRAYLSNLKALKRIILQRHVVQSKRKIKDSDVLKYISKSWFLWFRYKLQSQKYAQ